MLVDSLLCIQSIGPTLGQRRWAHCVGAVRLYSGGFAERTLSTGPNDGKEKDVEEIKVADVMTNLVVTFRPQDTIEEAAGRLLKNHISGAPVVVQGRLVGVVSEADIVSAYTPRAPRGSATVAPAPLMFLLRGIVPLDVDHMTVGDVMTTTVISLSPEASVWEAASLIDRHGVRRLPVVDDQGYVVGVLARADLVRAMAGPGKVA
jgi:CBS domain-containing protein